MNLEQIYERHADFVWRTLRRLGVAEGDARDATHDAFLIVHAELARFEGRSSLNTWLFTICRSVARDFRRRHSAPPANPPADFSRNSRTTCGTPTLTGIQSKAAQIFRPTTCSCSSTVLASCRISSRDSR
jgi:RNA polymerase sigma factor (sigma-70 family)